MINQTVITQDKFDKTLAWLNKDREAAGQKYEEIRRSLIKILTWRGCSDAEDLADEAMNRVVLKIDELAPSYKGDPALYFYGVAKRVLLEHQRRQKLRAPLPELSVNEAYLKDQLNRAEILYECLSRCISGLKPGEDELVLSYYEGDRQRKIDNRRKLALTVDVAANTLRVRVHRIRATLEKCINRCLKQSL
ncbi:MAG TPA: sigma factor [Pyrinomonadaceae bacterium]|jgi:RNA polymerase sigma factor (sigma-70 family)|nr:sigma factor [Pyrinomonadaceae bacterium]